MQDFPLTLPHLLTRAERLFAEKELVTLGATRRERRTYGAMAERARRLGSVLDSLGVSAGGRVGTFAWNTARHVELYFAAPCAGRVLHTINVQLTPDQLDYVVNHAEDEVIFVDRTLAHLLFPQLPRFKSVRHVIVMGDGPADVPALAAGPEVHDYETLLSDAPPAEFAVDDEYGAAAVCYTSGTTGEPKGVVYTHRSMFLHTLGFMSSLGIQEPDRVLPAVPMFHVNAWGMVHAAVAAGASLVLPGPRPAPGSIAELIETERVTVAAGVPTLWMSALPELVSRDTSSLRVILCGGSAVSRTLSEAYRATIGLPLLQAWGMTETGPLGAVCHMSSTLDADLDDDGRAELRTSVGQPVIGIEARIVNADVPGSTVSLPWDGTAAGELQVRGAWVASAYYDDPGSSESFTRDGWLRTGDIATIDSHGYVRIVDRSKDVIKSGGEWISSVALENELMAHPQVADAAVVAVSDHTWGERPLACVVLRPKVEASLAVKFALLAFLDERVPRWWLPEDIVFAEQLPRTPVGKVSKRKLRQMLADRLVRHELNDWEPLDGRQQDEQPKDMHVAESGTTEGSS
jgi:acyl-CoA synthetase (AMP-forming)/AMP-acid ligase II